MNSELDEFIDAYLKQNVNKADSQHNYKRENIMQNPSTKIHLTHR